MVGMFGSYEVTLNEMEHPFKDKERVTFYIKAFEIKAGDYGARVMLDCQVKSGDHIGKDYVFTVSMKDTPFQNAIRRKWLKCFFTENELIAGSYDGKKIIGKQFSAIPSNMKPQKEGDRGNTLWDLFAPVEPAFPSSADVDLGAPNF